MSNNRTTPSIFRGEIQSLLTPQEAAAFLRIGESTLSKWRFTGSQNLRFCKIGRRIRYSKNDLEAFVAANWVGGMS